MPRKLTMLNGKKALIVSQGPRNKVVAKNMSSLTFFFFPEKGGVEKDTGNAVAKLVQWVQSTVLIAVIKLGNKITDGKGGKDSISWCEL